MKTDKQTIYRHHSPLSAPAALSRRRFIQQSAALAAVSPMTAELSSALAAESQLSASRSHLATNPLGFNGERQDPATGLYPLGNGKRVYNPAMMRFHACDTMSPFGQGGINAYAYSLGDPINLRDPSGHFAISSLLIGTIVGAVAGAAISAAAEGISAAVTHNRFDWKSVAIGAAMGCISGGFGTVSLGASTNVQIGMAIYDAVTSGTLDFGLNVAAGANNKQAGINAGIGAVIGFATFGLGLGITRAVTRFKTSRPRHIPSALIGGERGVTMFEISETRHVPTALIDGNWRQVHNKESLQYIYTQSKEYGQHLNILADFGTDEHIIINENKLTVSQLSEYINGMWGSYNIRLLYCHNLGSSKFTHNLAIATQKKVVVPTALTKRQMCNLNTFRDSTQEFPTYLTISTIDYLTTVEGNSTPQFNLYSNGLVLI